MLPVDVYCHILPVYMYIYYIWEGNKRQFVWDPTAMEQELVEFSQ